MLMAAWNPLDPALIVTVAAFVALSVWTYLLAASVASAGAGRRHRAGRPVGQEIGRWLSAVVGWSRD
jgi:hypothetical protein